MSGNYSIARGTFGQVDWRVICRCASWGEAARLASAGVSKVFVSSRRTPPIGGTVALVVELPDGLHVDLRGRICEVISVERAHADRREPGAVVDIDERMLSELALLRGLIDEELRRRHETPITDMDVPPEVMAIPEGPVDGDSTPALRALGGEPPRTDTGYSVKLKAPRRRSGKLPIR